MFTEILVSVYHQKIDLNLNKIAGAIYKTKRAKKRQDLKKMRSKSKMILSVD